MDKKDKYEIKIGCVIMASGKSKRFGENKLLAEFREKSLIQTVLDMTGKNFIGRDLFCKDEQDEESRNKNSTEKNIFTKRLVLTRTWEVEKICRKQGIPVIYHELQKRNEAIRLGMKEMYDMDGVLFCPCDQPLLKQESLKRMVEEFRQYFEAGEEDVILRLGYESQIGTPTLFGKGNFEELQNLPEKCGGSRLCETHPERVRIIQAGNGLELFDIDTKEDLEYLMRLREL